MNKSVFFIKLLILNYFGKTRFRIADKSRRNYENIEHVKRVYRTVLRKELHVFVL